MKIQIVTCDDTCTVAHDIIKMLGAKNFDDGVSHKTHVAMQYIDAIVAAIKTDTTITLFARCGMVPNMIGHMIDAGIVDHTQVEIDLYTATTVEKSKYDKAGYLVDWRIGALEECSYEYIEEMKARLMSAES